MNSDTFKAIVAAAKAIHADASALYEPPAEGTIPRSELLLLNSLVKGTRGYIERVTYQINGTYEHGWYDACAVMIRRLLETLIIEAFEFHREDSTIKNKDGDFLYLGDLIPKTLSCPKWNLTRNAKQALPRLKDIGDKSAHSRRFNAHRGDIDRIASDLRVAVQELIYIANLK